MLKQMKIIVTGTASGIGKEVVRESLLNNASVIACDLNRSALETLELEMASDSLDTYSVDVSNYTDVVRLFTYIERKHPDLNGQNILEYRAEEIDKVFDINVKGYVYFSQLFGKKLLKEQRQGVIVNMSSVSGVEGSSDAIYGASKAAIL